MIYLEEERANQILLIAPDLLGESLALQLKNKNEIKVALSKEDLTSHPKLVIWCIDNAELPGSISIELNRLQERWNPSPILLLLPETLNLTTQELLDFNCAGLLQEPTLDILNQSIITLIKGGRVVKLRERQKDITSQKNVTLGLGQWLLISGIQEINKDLQHLEKLLNPPPDNIFVSIMMYGRKRELKQAKSLLNYLWGPTLVSIENIIPNKILKEKDISSYQTNIILNDRNPYSVWKEITARVKRSVNQELLNSSGVIFAFDAIKPSYKTELLLGLLTQIDLLIDKINASNDPTIEPSDLWDDFQIELRKQAIRSFIGSYVSLLFKGQNTIVVDNLVNTIDLSEVDNEMTPAIMIIDPIINKKPILVDGKLLPSDDPRALIHIETLVSNWMIRTAEIISSELLNKSYEWPEFRNYLLKKELRSTRELERLRNQLNSQNRWQEFVLMPIRLYESKRLLYRLNKGHIQSTFLTESRDEELQHLGWWQQQVALIVEARDAIAPQLQSLVKSIGNLMVLILTKIIGRAIGLVGKGIAQGMGKSLTKG